MSDNFPDYRNMSWGQLRRQAASGDTEAQDALTRFGTELQSLIESYDPTEPLRAMEAEYAERARFLEAALEEAAEAKATKEREAVAREEEMLRQLATMREATQRAEQRAEQREAVALERARVAEEREAARRKVAERREWAMAAMTLVAMIAAVVAIFA